MTFHLKLPATVGIFVFAVLTAACTPPADNTARSESETSAAAEVVNVGIEVLDASDVGAIQVDIDYSAADGAFVGAADEVQCETLVEGALSSYNNILADKMLRAAYVAVDGMDAPIRLADCKFSGTASVENFVIDIRDATSADLTPLAPPAQVVVVLE